MGVARMYGSAAVRSLCKWRAQLGCWLLMRENISASEYRLKKQCDQQSNESRPLTAMQLNELPSTSSLGEEIGCQLPPLSNVMTERIKVSPLNWSKGESNKSHDENNWKQETTNLPKPHLPAPHLSGVVSATRTRNQRKKTYHDKVVGNVHSSHAFNGSKVNDSTAV